MSILLVVAWSCRGFGISMLIHLVFCFIIASLSAIFIIRLDCFGNTCLLSYFWFVWDVGGSARFERYSRCYRFSWSPWFLRCTTLPRPQGKHWIDRHSIRSIVLVLFPSVFIVVDLEALVGVKNHKRVVKILTQTVGYFVNAVFSKESYKASMRNYVRNATRHTICKHLQNIWQFSLFDSIRRSLLLFRSIYKII